MKISMKTTGRAFSSCRWGSEKGGVKLLAISNFSLLQWMAHLGIGKLLGLLVISLIRDFKSSPFSHFKLCDVSPTLGI